MLREDIIHVNSNGDVLNFKDLRISIESNELRNYEWNYESKNDKITKFKKNISKKNMVFMVHCEISKANYVKNKFYEHFDVDVLNQKYGYFIINDYKYYCYLVKSVKDKYNISKRCLELSVDIATDRNYWVKENKKEINFSKITSDGVLKYPYTYSYVYSSLNTFISENDSIVNTDAIIRIFGACENPLLRINDNIYQVNASLSESEYLEIDTENKTIYKYSSIGDKTNLFNNRNKKYNIFEKIPYGKISISADDEYKVDIITFEKRGEPKWI